MARKTVGHIELVWRCPKCGSVNPGPQRFCTGCGAAQPADVKFEQPVGAELITNEAKKKEAAAGPDIHCPYCGARNPAGTEICHQCGGDLLGGEAREAGQVLGAFDTPEAMTPPPAGGAPEAGTPDAGTPVAGTPVAGTFVTGKPVPGAQTEDTAAPGMPVAAGAAAGSAAASTSVPQTPCPRCGTLNPNLALRCSNCGAPLEVQTVKPTAPTVAPARAPLPKWLIIAGALVLVAACIFIFSLIQRGQQTNQVRGVVQSVNWERIIPIEALVDVEYQAWRDEVPGGVSLGACREQMRYESAEPQPNSEEICGTPYTVNQGSGYAEVVQDCVYRVYDDFCSYTRPEWRVVDTARVSGADLNPRWPELSLAQGQRQGEQWQESYTIVFTVDGQQYSYPVSSLEAFDDFQPGSEWNLTVNGFGDLVGVQK